MADGSREVLSLTEPAVPIPAEFAAAEFANPLSPQVSFTQHSPSLPPLLARKEQSRTSLVVVAVLCLAVLAGIAAYVLMPGEDDRYVHDLTSAGLMSQYPGREAAIAHGQEFCRQLNAGREPSGYAAELIAVQAYCPQFAPGFTVLATPAELRARYLDLLQARGFGEKFASVPAAIAHAQAVCHALRAGGRRQGPPVDRVAVQVYCPGYLKGYRLSSA